MFVVAFFVRNGTFLCVGVVLWLGHKIFFVQESLWIWWDDLLLKSGLKVLRKLEETSKKQFICDVTSKPTRFTWLCSKIPLSHSRTVGRSAYLFMKTIRMLRLRLKAVKLRKLKTKINLTLIYLIRFEFRNLIYSKVELLVNNYTVKYISAEFKDVLIDCHS